MNTKIELAHHPCFNDEARHRFGRVHLPVAPQCNIQCNFCNRKYDCVNETRPGVTSTVLTPHQALEYLKRAMVIDPRLAVAGIAGPGDPFANADQTMATLRLVRKQFPKLLLCVATNAFNVLPYAHELAKLKVSHVTVTVNAVNPVIGGRIYAWVRDGKTICQADKGANLLIERQLLAIAALKKYGLTVKVNTIIIPGINDEHIPEVAKVVSELGADVMNCIPVYPTQGTVFESIPSPSTEAVEALREQVGRFLPLMRHCGRCRADAAGLVGEKNSEQMMQALAESARLPIRPEEQRPYVAVASREGFLVNQHLGAADTLEIWGEKDGKFRLIEKRATPEPGSGDQRWESLCRLLRDCRMVLTSGAGKNPTEILEKNGIRIVLMEGLIQDALEAVFGKGDLRKLQIPWRGCGGGCGGDGQGCG